jgi:D-alanyl-D-alanine carboxypeptidase/D-alanyl-D-alanine-endopeptidase (penicillin-binding protein 4)
VGRRDARHGSRLAFWLPVLLVLCVLGAAGTTYVVDPPDPDAPQDDPAAIAPPDTLDLLPVTAPVPVALPAAPGGLDATKIRRALAPLLDDADLGPHVLAAVAGLDGSPVFTGGVGVAIPASTLKLLTATAALETLGPDHTFATTVVADGARRVVLVGGGDPLLESADLKRLARRTAAQVTGRVRVGYDTSLFTGPDVSPHWPSTYVPEGVVAPITSLWVDEGRPEAGWGRVDDPAAVAATEFAAALTQAGVEVIGTPAETTAAVGSAELARVDSEPLDRIVEHTLETSDNEAAEVLARHVGLAAGGAASFAGGVRGILETLTGLGVPTDDAEVYDGSGLSRENLLDPDTLTGVLGVAGSVDQPDLRAVLTGLPVAAFSGSLVARFDDGAKAGRGLVRAKTGTLSGVSGLAGTVTDADGTPMLFVLLADRIDLVDTLAARDALDAAASALAACHCGAAGTVAP